MRRVPGDPGRTRRLMATGCAADGADLSLRLRTAPIVLYDPAMRQACLGVFDLNVPAFFSPSERILFEEYLEAAPARYMALLLDGGVAACGGFYVMPRERIAGLCWGMVRPDCQHRGAGKRMLLTRLRIVTLGSPVDRVILDTSQNAKGFYSHFGFLETTVKRDGYAPGLDRVEMTLPVDGRTRRNLLRRCRRLGFASPPELESGPRPKRKAE